MVSPRPPSPSCFSPSRGTPGDPAREGVGEHHSRRQAANPRRPTAAASAQEALFPDARSRSHGTRLLPHQVRRSRFRPTTYCFLLELFLDRARRKSWLGLALAYV